MARATISSAALGSACALRPRRAIEYVIAPPSTASNVISTSNARIVALQSTPFPDVMAFLNGIPRRGRRRESFM
jgi:hypothetical protein